MGPTCMQFAGLGIKRVRVRVSLPGYFFVASYLEPLRTARRRRSRQPAADPGAKSFRSGPRDEDWTSGKRREGIWFIRSFWPRGWESNRDNGGSTAGSLQGSAPSHTIPSLSPGRRRKGPPPEKKKKQGLTRDNTQFGTYLLFPIGIMYYFGTNLDNRFAVPNFWPKPEESNQVPHSREEIKAEYERIVERQRLLKERREAAARRDE